MEGVSGGSRGTSKACAFRDTSLIITTIIVVEATRCRRESSSNGSFQPQARLGVGAAAAKMALEKYTSPRGGWSAGGRELGEGGTNSSGIEAFTGCRRHAGLNREPLILIASAGIILSRARPAASLRCFYVPDTPSAESARGSRFARMKSTPKDGSSLIEDLAYVERSRRVARWCRSARSILRIVQLRLWGADCWVRCDRMLWFRDLRVVFVVKAIMIPWSCDSLFWNLSCEVLAAGILLGIWHTDR